MHEAKKQKTILIVEDDPVFLRALKDALSREEFRIVQARDGKEGLDSALREHPDLILLDIMLPVMDGVALLRALREDAWGKQAQVIILSNLNDDDKVAEIMTLGSYQYLVKSDHMIDEIVASVKAKLDGIG